MVSNNETQNTSNEVGNNTTTQDTSTEAENNNDNNKTENNEQTEVSSSEQNQNIITEGNQTLNTNANTNSDETNYYVSSKLDRDKMYAEMISNYENILNNNNASEAQKSIATQEITKINNTKNAIMICENLISTKGFENCIIFVNDKSVNVVVKVEGGLSYRGGIFNGNKSNAKTSKKFIFIRNGYNTDYSSSYSRSIIYADTKIK